MSYEFEKVELERMELRKQRDFGEKMNACFEFLKLNFAPFYRGILFIVLPLGILAGVAASMMAFQPANLIRAMDDPEAMREMADNIFGIEYFLAIGFGILGFIVLPAFVYPYMRKYLDNETDYSVSALFSEVRANFFPVLGTMLVLGLMVGGIALLTGLLIGLLSEISKVLVFFGAVAMFCVIMYFFVTLTLVLPIIIFERVGLGAAISKSFYLIKDNWWATFGLLFIMNTVCSLIGLVFNIPLFVLLGLIASNTLENASAITDFSNILANVIAQIGNYAVYPLYMIALAFQYFNLTEEKDSIGLLSRIDDFGQGESNDEEEIY